MASRCTQKTLLPIVLKILVITFIFDMLGLLLLHRISSGAAGGVVSSLIDASFLTLLAAPFVWWFVVRPVSRKAEKNVDDAQKLLQQSEQDWEEAFNTITDMITVHDRDFNIIRANASARKALGLSVFNAAAVKCFAVYHGTAMPPHCCPSCRSLASGEPSVSEIFEPHLNKFIEIRAIPRLDDRNSVIGLIHVVRDITDRKRMEDALMKSENRLRAIIEAVPECVMLLNADGTLIEMNPAGIAMIEADSQEHVAGKSVYPLIVPECRSAFEELNAKVLRGGTGSAALEITGFRGTRRWVETRSVPLGDGHGAIIANLCVARDITDQKKLEAQLRHAHKMEAIGTLSGGIAHDFNNILTAIIGYANIMKLKLAPDHPAGAFADQILASAERATGLTQSLLAFSRKTVTAMRPVDLDEVVQRSGKLMRSLIGENITLHLDLACTGTAVQADIGQIEQVIMNLITNARDAMPEGGTLSVATRIEKLSADFIRTHGFGKEGIYNVLSITDTGIGMDAGTRDRVFEPFFTTKDVGKGTGLGLSIVYGIVKSHNGFIVCRSAPGRGTTFSLYLPLVRLSVIKEKPELSPLPRGGTETIFLAEDDPAVRHLTRTFLEDFGYTIVEAGDGEAAVQRLREFTDPVHLLLLDVVMPKMDGREVYETIKGSMPGVKVLFMSGYNAATIAKQGILEKGHAYLPKPVSPETLLKKVREVLDA